MNVDLLDILEFLVAEQKAAEEEALKEAMEYAQQLASWQDGVDGWAVEAHWRVVDG